MTSAPSHRPIEANAGRRKVNRQRYAELLSQVSQLWLQEGFLEMTMDDLAGRLRCSKATLYSVAGPRRELIRTVVKQFFEEATRNIEEATAAEVDCRRKVKVYLRGVGREMSRHSAQFYTDMMAYEPAARIYGINSEAASRRVREIIDEGVQLGQFRPVDASFTSELIVLAIDGVRSGRLLERTGLTAGEAFVEIAEVVLEGLQYHAAR